EAKISFTAGLAIIVLVICVPVVSWLTRVDEPAPQPPVPAAPAPPPSSPGLASDSTARPRSAASASSNGGPVSAGTPSTDPVVEAPMPVSALTVLKGLYAHLNAASHLPPGVIPGNLDPAQDLPEGALDGSPAEVMTNLQLAQLRVASQPALALRVVREERSTVAYKFDLEIVSS